MPTGDSVDMRQQDVGHEANFHAISVAEEKARGGWTLNSASVPLSPPAPIQMGCGGGEQGFEDASTDES